jgi:hypothetical protein
VLNLNHEIMKAILGYVISLLLLVSVNLMLFVTNTVWSQSFTNSTSAACDAWNSGNAYTGFQRTIAVAGLPASMGTGAGQVVLKQINLRLGSPTCRGNLSTYYVRLISPDGTTIQVFSQIVTTSTSQWIDIKIRDHVALKRPKDYSLTTQQAYWPWSIGYYRTDAANAFSSVNGENPNGNWILQIAENTASEVSFEQVDLIFGESFTINDVTGNSDNNECSNSTCFDNTSIAVGTINGYSEDDPNYPGNTVGGCSWNGANNNSAWFSFVPSAATAYITISGITNTASPTSADTQLLIFTRPSGACSGTVSVPSGGCPDDQPLNNSAYITTNGGSTSANVYVNGISANAEFNLSGLTIGQTYYLYVDGNGGTSSNFYIEAINNCEPCSALPVTWSYFEAFKEQRTSQLYWVTASEINNNYFEVLRSRDMETWEVLGQVAGAGNSSTENAYHFTDFQPYIGVNYYRIKQVDFDGKFDFSEVKAVSFLEDMMVVPNPTNGDFTVVGLNDHTNNHIVLLNALGQLIEQVEIKGASYTFSNTTLAAGVYYISVNNSEKIKLIIFH